MGDHRARLELERPDPDLAVAREGFLAGKNDPDDVDGMIMLFRRFRDVSFMSRAIGIWAEADEHIAELNDAAAELHAAHRRRRNAAGGARPILVRIDDVNRRLTPLEEAFSSTLGEASRRTQTILEVALVLTAMLLVDPRRRDVAAHAARERDAGGAALRRARSRAGHAAVDRAKA